MNKIPNEPGNVWLGPNSGYGTAFRHTEGPHDFPLTSSAINTLEPIPGKSHVERAGLKAPIYKFEQWQRMCPFEHAASNIFEVLGYPAEELLSEGIAPTPLEILERNITLRMITLLAYHVTFEDMTGLPEPLNREAIECLLFDATASGDPIAYLDKAISKIQS